MSLSPSPVEQVNDVVIAHYCWSLIGLNSPTCRWAFNSQVKNKWRLARPLLLQQKSVCGWSGSADLFQSSCLVVNLEGASGHLVEGKTAFINVYKGSLQDLI